MKIFILLEGYQLSIYYAYGSIRCEWNAAKHGSM